jgi:hypothetical protein
MQVAAAAVAAAGVIVALVQLWRLWPTARELAGALPTPTAGATDFPVAVIATSLVVLVVLALTERSPLRADWR